MPELTKEQLEVTKMTAQSYADQGKALPSNPNTILALLSMAEEAEQLNLRTSFCVSARRTGKS